MLCCMIAALIIAHVTAIVRGWLVCRATDAVDWLQFDRVRQHPVGFG